MEEIKQKVKGYKFDSEISKNLRKLSALDNYHGILALVQDWGIIALSILISQKCFYLYPICLLIIGSRQRALSTILHDAAHGILARNRKLNYILGTLFSGHWLLQSFNKYRDSHVRKHHVYLGDENSDPDYQFYIEIGLYDSKLKPFDFLIQHILATILLLKVPSYLQYLIKNRISTARSYPLEFTFMGSLWIILLFFSFKYNFLNLILYYWIIPFLTTHMIIGYFIEIAEHYPYLGTSRKVIHLSRNRFSHWVEGLIFSIHNENYHLVHHLRPSIPFWNMVKAHKLMLQDKNYKDINQNFGGIFSSNNSKKPLMIKLTDNRAHVLENSFKVNIINND